MTARDRILAALEKFAPTPVEVPELGGAVYVRPLSVLGMGKIARRTGDAAAAVAAAKAAAAAKPEDAELQAAARAADNALADAHARSTIDMLADCLVDEHGKPMFVGEDDIARLSQIPGMIVDRLMVVIQKSYALDSSGHLGASGN